MVACPRMPAAGSRSGNRPRRSRNNEVIGMPVTTETGQQEQMQQLLAGLTAVRGGDCSIRRPEGQDALMNEIAAVFNAMKGQLGGQAEVPAVAGTWKDLTDSVNAMAGNLTGQVRAIAQVTTAVARGDL